MTGDRDLFTFVSSYRGELDYRRRADGRRWRVRRDDPLRLPSPCDGTAGTPADVLAEWRRWRLAERAEFVAWCERRTLDPGEVADLLAESWPDLAEVTP